MKVLRAYNSGSERILSPRLLVVDAARESVAVRRIFAKGLPSEARNGILLVNFQTVPETRRESAFDLIYLDEEYRVLQVCEISQDEEFEPFKGQSTSALILPPKTVARSKTFTGDRIAIDQIENQSSEYIQTSSPDPPAQPSSRSASPPKAKSSNVPSKSEQETRPATASVSGRIMRGADLSFDRSSILRPVNPSAAAQSTEIRQATPESKALPFSGSPGIERSGIIKSPLPPEPERGAPVATPAAPDLPVGATRLIAPIPRDFAPHLPKETPAEPEIRFEPKRTIAPAPSAPTPSLPAPVITELPSNLEQPLVTHSFPANKVEPLEPQPESLPPKQAPVESQPQAPAKSGNQIVNRGHKSSSGPDLDVREKLAKRIRTFLSSAEKIDPKVRRAPRINAPGFVAYYFAGGPSTPHEIRNISAVGFYMVTDQRWMIGTVIRVTLQRIETDAYDAKGITALARVVRWDSDGGGFEFVFPELKD